MELPGQDGSVRTDAAADINHACGTEVCPRELLFTRPGYFDRALGRASQAGCFDRGLSRVLAPVTGAGVGHENANLLLRNVERAGKFSAHAERPLRSCPYGETITLPLRKSNPRLEWRMRDVVDRIALLHAVLGRGGCFFDRAGLELRSISRGIVTRARILLQILE